MDVFECAMTRRSIRKYKSIPIEWDKIGKILEAAHNTPTAGNLQNFRFIIVTSEATRKQLAEACLQQNWMETAPVHIVVCAEPDKSRQFYGLRGERLYSLQNCAASVQTMLLVANSEGLGSCWVGAFEEEMVKRAVKLPESARPQAIVTLGYPDEIVPKPLKFRMDNLTFLEAWGNRIADMDIYMGYYSKYVQEGLKKAKNFFESVSRKLQKKK